MEVISEPGETEARGEDEKRTRGLAVKRLMV